MQTLVTAKWVSRNLNRVRILDASWHLPNANRNAAQEFIQKRLPSAKFWDIDGIADLSTDLPHI